MALSEIGALSVKITADNKGLKKGLGEVTSQLKAMDSNVTSSSKNMQQWSLKSIAATVGLTAAMGAAVKKSIEYTDAFTSMTNKLKLTVSSTEELTDVTQKLFGVANETRSSVESTTELYAKMYRATRDLGIGQDRLLKVTESVNKAFAIGGASTQEATGSIRQLAQALASGALRGDEFNSIAEGAPIIMEAVRVATGKTAGELRELAATGAITADILIKSLELYASRIDSDFATSTATFGQKLEVAKNQAIEFVGGADAITEAVTDAGDALIFLSKHIGDVADVAKGAAFIYGSTLTVGLYNSVKAMNVAAISAGKLSAAMALMGGPVGIAITVVAALALFTTNEDYAGKAIKSTTDEVDGQIKALKGLSAQMLDSKMDEYISKQEEIGALINLQKIAIQETIAANKNDPSIGSAVKMAQAQEKLNFLYAQRNEYMKLGNKIFNASGIQPDAANTGPVDTPNTDPTIDIDAISAQKKVEEALAKHLETMGKMKDADFEKTLMKQVEETTTLMADLEQRYKSKEQLENEAYAREKELIMSTYDDVNNLTAEQQIQQQNMLNEHLSILDQIKADKHSGILGELEMQYMSELDLLAYKYSEEQRMLEAAILQEGLTKEEATSARNALIAKHAQDEIDLDRAKNRMLVGMTASLMDSTSQMLQLGGEKAQKIGKKIAIARAVLAGGQAAVDAWRSGMETGGPFAPLVAAAYTAASVARTATMISQLKSGGKVSGGGRGSIPNVSAPSSSSGGGGDSAPASPRNISINLTGSSLFSADTIRELIGQINEQVGDGVSLSTSGGT